MAVPFEITVEDLKKMREDKTPHRLIDVREPHEVAIASIGGELMPMNTIPSRLQELDPEEDLIIYCRSGARSGQVVEFLRRNGFEKARNLQGGILAWSDRIDPAVKKY